MNACSLGQQRMAPRRRRMTTGLHPWRVSHPSQARPVRDTFHGRRTTALCVTHHLRIHLTTSHPLLPHPLTTSRRASSSSSLRPAPVCLHSPCCPQELTWPPPHRPRLMTLLGSLLPHPFTSSLWSRGPSPLPHPCSSRRWVPSLPRPTAKGSWVSSIPRPHPTVRGSWGTPSPRLRATPRGTRVTWVTPTALPARPTARASWAVSPPATTPTPLSLSPSASPAPTATTSTPPRPPHTAPFTLGPSTCRAFATPTPTDPRPRPRPHPPPPSTSTDPHKVTGTAESWEGNGARGQCWRSLCARITAGTLAWQKMGVIPPLCATS